MGTDIHGVFQRHDKDTGQWCDVPSNYEQDRHYQLFAVLAAKLSDDFIARVCDKAAERY